MALFENNELSKAAPSLFAAGEVLTAGGTVSQAANAVLERGVASNGTPAEPELAGPGSNAVRGFTAWDKQSMNTAIAIGFAVVLFAIAVVVFKVDIK